MINLKYTTIEENLPSFSVLLELFTMFMNSLRPSSLLMFSSVGGGIDSTGFPSRETKIALDSKALFLSLIHI